MDDHFEGLNFSSDNTVPFTVHESALARAERHNKRLWVLCIIIFVSLIATNAGWIWYESQFEDVVVTQEAETDGSSNVILSGQGDVYYGEGETDNQNEAP